MSYQVKVDKSEMLVEGFVDGKSFVKLYVEKRHSEGGNFGISIGSSACISNHDGTRGIVDQLECYSLALVEAKSLLESVKNDNKSRELASMMREVDIINLEPEKVDAIMKILEGEK